MHQIFLKKRSPYVQVNDFPFLKNRIPYVWAHAPSLLQNRIPYVWVHDPPLLQNSIGMCIWCCFCRVCENVGVLDLLLGGSAYLVLLMWVLFCIWMCFRCVCVVMGVCFWFCLRGVVCVGPRLSSSQG